MPTDGHMTPEPSRNIANLLKEDDYGCQEASSHERFLFHGARANLQT